MKIAKVFSHLFLTSILTLSIHQVSEAKTIYQPENYQITYQDWWWNPAQSGMGVNIGQQGDTLVVAWYHFDSKGNATYLMLSGPLEENRLSGILYRTTGPAPGPGYDRTSVKRTEVGTATLEFLSPGAATFDYTYDGKSGSIPLQRFLYTSPPSDTNVIMLSGKRRHTGCKEGWPRNLARSLLFNDEQTFFQTTVQLEKTGHNRYNLSFSLFDEDYYYVKSSSYKKDIANIWCTAKDIELTTESGMYTGTANVTCQATAFSHPYEDDGNDIIIGIPLPPWVPPPPQPEFIALNRAATLTVKQLKIDPHNSIFDFTLDFNNTTAKTCELYVKHLDTGNKPHRYYWRTEGERIALIQACENYPTPEPDEGIKTVTLPSTCTVSGYTEGVSVAITP